MSGEAPPQGCEAGETDKSASPVAHAAVPTAPHADGAQASTSASRQDRAKIADFLARRRSYTLYLKTHNFHWNVTGPMFNTLHAMFDDAIHVNNGPRWTRSRNGSGRLASPRTGFGCAEFIETELEHRRMTRPDSDFADWK
jgi:hypothetical protein